MACSSQKEEARRERSSRGQHLIQAVRAIRDLQNTEHIPQPHGSKVISELADFHVILVTKI